MNKVVTSALFLLAAIGFFIASFFMPTFEEFSNNFTNPTTFPKLLSGFFIFVSAGHLLYVIRQNKTARESSKFTFTRKQLILLGILTVYLIVLPIVHFIPATIAFMLILTAFLLPDGERKKGMVIGAVITAVLISAIYYLFAVQLNVFLP